MENKENEEMNDVEKVSEDKKENKQSKSFAEKEGIFKFINTRIVSLFVLGILLGFFIKTHTAKTIVIGANDPKLEKTRGDYMFSKIGQEKMETETVDEGVENTEEIDVNAPEDLEEIDDDVQEDIQTEQVIQ